jgi:hypothetical protein
MSEISDIELEECLNAYFVGIKTFLKNQNKGPGLYMGILIAELSACAIHTGVSKETLMGLVNEVWEATKKNITPAESGS